MERDLGHVRSCDHGGRVAAFQVPFVVSFDEIFGTMEWARKASEIEKESEEYMR